MACAFTIMNIDVNALKDIANDVVCVTIDEY